MTRDETIRHLTSWMTAHDRLKAQWEAMAAAFGVGMAYSPLWEASWKMFEAYTATLGDMIGENGAAWLEWFCYENDMGGKGYPAGYDGRMAPIETLGDLADLIVEGRKRG